MERGDRRSERDDEEDTGGEGSDGGGASVEESGGENGASPRSPQLVSLLMNLRAQRESQGQRSRRDLFREL